MSNVKKSALGRGLGALLEDNSTDITSNLSTSGMGAVAGSISNIPLASIETNPFQPRDHFDQAALQELSNSIKEHGIIQPITVRKLGYDKYQLISGERRFRASKLAGLTEVPAYIRIANDQAMLEMALVENIQRENLNPIEVSISYKRLIEECSLTQEEMSDRVGKNRSTVTNYLRLLKLPPEIQAGIRDQKITMSHARAIINIDDVATQLAIYHEIIDGELSVRKVEELAKGALKKPTKNQPFKTPQSLEIKKVQDTLSSKFETKIEVKTEKNGKGKILIPFMSDDDLNRILDLLDY
jgi:ParB family chromosome partitioning protein